MAPGGEDSLRVRVEGAIGTVTIDRPEKRNALSQAMWAALPGIADRLGDDPAVDVVVLRGPAGGPFSAGADIAEFETLRTGDNARRYGEIVHAGVSALAGLPKPTIALVEGWCVGGGCELALACDLRVADPAARFGITPAKLGLVYSATSTARLVDTVGPAAAKRILFTGDLLTADEALRIGLVTSVSAAAEDDAYALARTVAARAAVTVRAAKALIGRVVDGHRGEDEVAHALYEESYGSPEYAEGVAAFLAKRPPDFAAARSRRAAGRSVR